MTAPAGKLKRPSGWFAAGREVSRALAVLSDGAFRLFIYFTHGELAKAVGRSRRSIIIYMDELQRQQVCQSATNQHVKSKSAMHSGHTRKLEKKKQHKTGRVTLRKSSV